MSQTRRREFILSVFSVGGDLGCRVFIVSLHPVVVAVVVIAVVVAAVVVVVVAIAVVVIAVVVAAVVVVAIAVVVVAVVVLPSCYCLYATQRETSTSASCLFSETSTTASR